MFQPAVTTEVEQGIAACHSLLDGAIPSSGTPDPLTLPATPGREQCRGHVIAGEDFVEDLDFTGVIG
jgi:hypothetical protein